MLTFRSWDDFATSVNRRLLSAGAALHKKRYHRARESDTPEPRQDDAHAAPCSPQPRGNARLSRPRRPRARRLRAFLLRSGTDGGRDPDPHPRRRRAVQRGQSQSRRARGSVQPLGHRGLRLDVWTIDGEALRWVGVFLFAIGGALRLWPVFVLGRRFSGLVAIRPGHELVTSGVYGVIRHPSYLGIVVISLGWALAFRSGVGVLLTAATIPPLVARMNAEERLLLARFGDEYEAYRARTRRLIPGLY